MSELLPDQRYFARAVTQFGEKRPVFTSRDIFNSKGVKIIEAGVAVNSSLYERLLQHQLDRPLQNSVESPPTVTPQALRDRAAMHLEDFPFFAGMGLDSAGKVLLLECMLRLPLPQPIAFQLTLARETMPELYDHLVLSALVAAWLAMDTKVSRLHMSAAAAAGMLHDLGLLHLDPALQNHRKDLDAAQYRQLFSHPLVSALLIEPHPEYGQDVPRGVREHYEFLDGSGYPVGLGGQQISRIGRILALTELVLGTFTRGGEAPRRRLSVQLRLNSHRYDRALVEKVMAALQPHLEQGISVAMLLKDPVAVLLDIDQALAAWPRNVVQVSGLTAQQRQTLDNIGRQVSQLHRMLARSGVAPEQLGQLGSDALHEPLQSDLSLLAREAAWQLGALAREVRRQMGAYNGRPCPPELEAWVTRVTATTAVSTEKSDDAVPAEQLGA